MTIGFTDLLQGFIALDGIIQRLVTNFTGRLVFTVAHHALETGSFLVVGAIVDSVGVKGEYVAETRQRDFRHIGGVYLLFSQADREIFVPG
jgi:hypothetical protein